MTAISRSRRCMTHTSPLDSRARSRAASTARSEISNGPSPRGSCRTWPSYLRLWVPLGRHSGPSSVSRRILLVTRDEGMTAMRTFVTGDLGPGRLMRNAPTPARLRTWTLPPGTGEAGRGDLVVVSADSAAGAPRIVVGVDGSRSSRAALRWAVRQARFTGGTVNAVIAWQIPTMLESYSWAPIYLEEAGDFAEDARKKIDAVISDEVKPADAGWSGARSSTAIRPRSCWTPRPAPTCSWWAAAATAASPRPCSARWASIACIIRTARC